MSRADEARRQWALLACLSETNPATQPSETMRQAGLDTDDAGLHAYRAHALVLAARVLNTHFPTLRVMVGEEAMAVLAWRLWRSNPPSSGDLADWGEALPELIQASTELGDWPWLADMARLEWARHRCARAAAVPLDSASLLRLDSDEAPSLHLHLQAHVALVPSRWPLLALWSAHQLPTAEQQAAAAKAALTARAQDEAHHVLVWQAQGQVDMAAIPASEAQWMAALLAEPPATLGTLLDHCPSGFDLGAWLSKALQRGLIAAVRGT